jgi:hypothetical protein
VKLDCETAPLYLIKARSPVASIKIVRIIVVYNCFREIRDETRPLFGCAYRQHQLASGAMLPCIRSIIPLVWRVDWPEDIANEVRKKGGTVSNSDVEAAAVFIAEFMLDDELNGVKADVSSHIGTRNKATEGWYNRKPSRASHKAPERFLHWLAMRQRWTRRGPQDMTYYEGERNLNGSINTFTIASSGTGLPRQRFDTRRERTFENELDKSESNTRDAVYASINDLTKKQPINHRSNLHSLDEPRLAQDTVP